MLAENHKRILRNTGMLYMRMLLAMAVTLYTTRMVLEVQGVEENRFRDVNIAFANELSMTCDKLDINVWELIRLANRHPLVNILQPGPCVGDHCIAVDPWFIFDSAPEFAKLIRAAPEVNDNKPHWVILKINEAVRHYLQLNPEKTAREVTLAAFGLSFKPNIDDLRENPALHIAEQIAEQHPGKLLIVESNIPSLPPKLANKSTLFSADDALIQADIVLLLVDHDEFKELSIPKHFTSNTILDTRGAWRPVKGQRS